MTSKRHITILLSVVLLIGCGGSEVTQSPQTATGATQEQTAQPTATRSESPGSAAPEAGRASPSPAQPSEEPLTITAGILPEARAARFSKDIRIVRILIENQTVDQFRIDVAASCETPDLIFTILDREHDQLVSVSGQVITQTNVVMEPRVFDLRSYKIVFFGLTQSEQVTAGTHLININITAPDLEPIRQQVIFEVTEVR